MQIKAIVMIRKYKYVLLILITNIIIFLSTYIYMQINKTKAIWYQHIADRFYYLNYLLKEGKDNVILHTSPLVISDIVLIGEEKIDINDLTDTYQYTFLCAKYKKDTSKILKKFFNKSKQKNIYKKEDFLKGLDKISNYCNLDSSP